MVYRVCWHVLLVKYFGTPQCIINLSLIKKVWLCILCKPCFKSVLHGCCTQMMCMCVTYIEEGCHGVGARGEAVGEETLIGIGWRRDLA